VNAWSRCTACKRDIGFGAIYWQCSVSTCNRRNTDYTFCSVACWDSHIATLRHRDAWAVEAKAPTREAWQREQDGGAKAAPIIASAPATPARSPGPPSTATAASSSTSGPSPAPASSGGPDGPRRLLATPPAGGHGSPLASSHGAPGSHGTHGAPGAQLRLAEAEEEVLIVVSKLKKYIRERSGMNTSDAVADALSAHVRAICDEAIRNAATDERKTVLDRDVPRPRR
jgi:hypothetical protein